MIRSPFFYVGDKYKLTPTLNEIFPKKINRLIEPFCGGGSVFLNIDAKTYLANDNNAYMIKLHKFLNKYASKKDSFFKELEKRILSYGLSASYLGITTSDELKKRYVKTYYAVYNKTAYKKAKADFNNNKKDLMLLYILLIYGFNHMLRFNSEGDFNLPVGNVDYNKNVRKALEDYFDFSINNSIEFCCCDYIKFINSVEFKEGDFVYLDPPYLISASEYNRYWTEKNEKELLSILDELNNKGIKFALSNVLIHKGRTNEILSKWINKYHVYHIKANYISYHDNTQKNSDEIVVTNY